MADLDPNVAALIEITDEAIKDLPEKNVNITKKQLSTIMSKVFSGVVHMMKTIKDEMCDKVTILESENSKLKKKLLQTNVEHEQLQQYINRDTLKICNIKEPNLAPNQQENVNETVIKVLEKAGITIREEDISVCHRLPVSRGSKLKHKSIIVKLTRREVRNTIIKQKKDKIKDNVDFQAEYPDSFMSEHLTPLRSKAA